MYHNMVCRYSTQLFEISRSKFRLISEGHKLAALLALSTAERSSDLSLLSINHFTSSSVVAYQSSQDLTTCTLLRDIGKIL